MLLFRNILLLHCKEVVVSIYPLMVISCYILADIIYMSCLLLLVCLLC